MSSLNDCAVCGEYVSLYKPYVEVGSMGGWRDAIYHAGCVNVEVVR